MTRQFSRVHNGFNKCEQEKPRGMAAVGEMPARDREFEALLQRAAEFQKVDSGCKLRGEAN